MEQTTIIGEVTTIDGTYVPGSMVMVLKNGERACESCVTKVSRDRSYKMETSLPPGTYTLIAYGKGYLNDDLTKELKRGLNDKIDFTLKNPSARVHVRGIATDQQGAVLSSATIVLYAAGCKACEIERITTSADGEYVVAGLAAPAKYLVGVQMGERLLGYNSLEVGDQPEQTVALAFQLLPVSEVVNVAANPPETSTDVALSITSLPFDGKSFSEVLSLGIGQVNSSVRASSINGVRANGVNITQDGIQTNDTLSSSSPPPVGLSSVGVFRFSQTGFQSVQLNKSPGDQIDISTRSGNNDFHGGVNYQIINDALNARNFFSLPGFDTFRQHTGSAKVGGPIRRNKLFFFVNYEIERKAEAPSFSTLLSSQVTALNQQLRRLRLPAEDLRRFVTTSASDSPLLRLDHNINAYNSLKMIYSFRRSMIRKDLTSAPDGTSSTPSTARDISDQNHFLSFSYARTISPTLLSESSYNYQSNSITLVPLEPLQPSMLIPGLALLGRATSLIEGDGHKYISHLIAERITIIKGNHRMEVGGHFDFNKNLFRFAAFESGRVVISSLAALSTNVPTADLFQLGRGGSQVRFNFSKIVVYYHDNFQVNSDFSVNFGLRYKLELPPSPQQKDTRGLQPKLGFAWNVLGNQETVLRAGYTLHRSFLPSLPLGFQLLMGGQGLQSIEPARRVISFAGQPAATIAFNQFITNASIPTGSQMAVTYDPASRSPIVHAFDVSLDQSLGRRMVLDISYSHKRGSNLLTSTNVNLPLPILINGRFDFRNASVNPNFAQLYQFETTGRSSYHAGTVTLFRHFSSGLGFNAAYTFSKAIDDVPSLKSVDVIPAGSFEATPENVFDRGNERAISAWNPTHRLSNWAIWEVPKADRQKAGHLRRALGTLFFSEGLLIESGRHFNVTVGSDVNHDGNPLTDRPLTVGRNTFFGQKQIQLDARIGSNIGLKEQQRVRLSVQIFNVLNRTNFSSYNTVLSKPDLSGLDPRIVFGSSHLPGFDFRQPLTASGFGLGTNTFGPRRVRLEVSYEF